MSPSRRLAARSCPTIENQNLRWSLLPRTHNDPAEKRSNTKVGTTRDEKSRRPPGIAVPVLQRFVQLKGEARLEAATWKTKGPAPESSAQAPHKEWQPPPPRDVYHSCGNIASSFRMFHKLIVGCTSLHVNFHSSGLVCSLSVFETPTVRGGGLRLVTNVSGRSPTSRAPG